MRALLVGDVHLSDRPPSVRTETYADDILAKLGFCVDQANRHADVLVLLGDVFHLKVPSKTSHRLVQRTAAVLEEFNGRTLIVPGNHDMSQDRLESLPQQPLGTLALSPKIEILTGFDIETGIFGIPYLQDWTTLPGWINQVGGSTLVVTHAPIFPPGQTPPYDFIPAADWADLMVWEVPVAYGHIHDPHGFYQVDGVWFCNNGAISRGSLHAETLKRHPKVTLFDQFADGCPFTSIDVPHRPAEEVFRLAEHAEKLAREDRLDTFLAEIDQVSLTALHLEDVLTAAATVGLPPAAQRELAEIVEFAVHQ